MIPRSRWPTVSLGEALEYHKDFVTIDDLATYRRPRVQLHAQGIVLRDEILGATIKTKKQQVCHAGDFLVAEIDAKVGGFGIVPESLGGSIVSSHYFLYAVDETRLHRSFLDYFIRTPAFREQVEAQGSTNYAAIRPSDVLGYEIPLPPLAEQRRIVARIEELAALIDEARALRQRTADETRVMLSAAFAQAIAEAPQRPMREVAPIVRRPVELASGGSYPELGVRSFGKGTFHKPALSALEVGSKRIFRIEPGDLLFSNVFAWEGAIAVARPEDAGRVGSHRFITCVPRAEQATADFLRFFFLTREGLELIGGASPGGAGRNRTLGLGALQDIPVPVPAIERQRWFDTLQASSNALARLRQAGDPEFDALHSSILARAFEGRL
jgi:type I restriction enzyme S subunit